MYFVNKPTQQPSRHHVREAAPPLEHTLKGQGRYPQLHRQIAMANDFLVRVVGIGQI
ncbi:hypothetical protein GBA52_004955 [Prunus armeniaca]|nr:hypothetical protein GBA52_004955 [Prunus armeniaca]